MDTVAWPEVHKSHQNAGNKAVVLRDQGKGKTQAKHYQELPHHHCRATGEAFQRQLTIRTVPLRKNDIHPLPPAVRG
jgi:hypothetical protein